MGTGDLADHDFETTLFEYDTSNCQWSLESTLSHCLRNVLRKPFIKD